MTGFPRIWIALFRLVLIAGPPGLLRVTGCRMAPTTARSISPCRRAGSVSGVFADMQQAGGWHHGQLHQHDDKRDRVTLKLTGQILQV